ncbi:MAG: hypothetical protein H0V18_02740 [Pyrinomonadaceae bacterium]|nr:hypothetical protein [Pyrinomonadaceae bacterium]
MSETKHLDGNQWPAGNAEASDSENIVLQEGLDYYLENGLLVFTAAFLGRRGYCCERGCRHCPYGYSVNENQEG